jgi:hypothetical protein
MHHHSNEQFFSLLRYALGAASSFDACPTGKEWDSIYVQAVKQSVIALLFTGVNRLRDEQEPPFQLALKWAADAEDVRALNELLNSESKRITCLFEAEGCHTAILKGQANARLYPDPFMRQPGDIDLWVDGGRASVESLLQEMNLLGEPSISKHHVELAKKGSKVPVEIHFKPAAGLRRPRTNRALMKFLDEEILKSEMVPEGFYAPPLKFALVMQLSHIYQHFFGSGIKQGDVIRIGQREGMVGSHQSLFLVAPLEQGEVNYPEALEHVLVAQSQTVAHLQTQRAELGACLVGLVTAENQYKVTVLGTSLFLQLLPNLRLIELVDRGLHSTIGIELHIYQSLGTDLRTLHEIGELVELLAGVIGTSGNHNTTNVFSLVENRKFARTFQHVHQFDELHTETQVGFVTTEAAHGLMPRHSFQLGQFYPTHLFKQMAREFLEDFKHIFLVGKRHLAVNLCELRLTVGAQVLVTETLRNLEIAVKTTHHQQLLEGLR